MKLIKLMMVSVVLLLTNLSAAIISGYCFDDLNHDGINDDNELCADENVWAKIINETVGSPGYGHVTVSKNLYSVDPDTSGYFEFNTHSKIGTFRVFLDNNADAKDTVATPPANTHITSDPDSGYDVNGVDGEATYNIDGTRDYDNQDFGIEFGADCVCEGADGNIIKKTMNIDGNVSEWFAVHADADNNICDHGDEHDKDAVVQSTGRNLVQFTWTGNDTWAYGFTRRVGSSSNTQTFIYYADRDGDGMMETGDFALAAGWQGNTGATSLYFYPYLPADPVNGDPMVWQPGDEGQTAPGGQIVTSDWIGSGDGYTLAGNLGNGVDLIAAGDGFAQGVTEASGGLDDAGVTMEWSVRWSAIYLEPFQGITYHVSSMNSSINDNNPPGQVDDNMAGCYGEATLKQCGVTLVPDHSITLSTNPSGPYYFEHNLTNTGNVDDNLTLTWSQTSGNFNPTSVTFYNDPDGDGNVSTGPAVLLVGDIVEIAAGESISLLVGVGLPSGLDDNTTILEINATTTACDINHSAVVTDTIIVSPLSFDLEVIKKVNGVDAIVADEGEQVTYEINVTNLGPDNATNVTVEDYLPGDVIYDSHTASPGTYDETTGIWDIGDLNVSDTATLTIDVNVSHTAGGGTVIQNIASTSDTNNTDTNDQDDANITAIHIPIADLQISKVPSIPNPHVGDDINYTISVINLGPDTATNISLDDILPGDLNCTDDNGTGLCSGSTWNIPDMLAGDVVTVIIQAKVNPGVVGGDLIINTAEVSSTVIDPDPSNNVSTAVMIVDDHTDLGVVKTVDNPTPSEGNTIVYTISVTNYGPHDTTNVVVQEEPLNGVTVTGTSVTQGEYIAPNWTVGDLNVSDTETLTITATVDIGSAGLDLINVARIASLDQNDTNGTNDVARAIVMVDNPLIDIEKFTNGIDADTGTGPEVDINSTVNWTYVITNTGNVNLTNIVVTDDIEGVITTCPQTALAVGESMICTETGIAIDGQYENNATVTAMTPNAGIVTDSDLSHYFGGICPCDNISSDSSSAMNKTVGALMILLTVMIGLFFMRREEIYHTNER